MDGHICPSMIDIQLRFDCQYGIGSQLPMRTLLPEFESRFWTVMVPVLP